MFSVHTTEIVNIHPVVPEKRRVQESSAQTHEPDVNVQVTQTPELRNARIQTDIEGRRVSCVEFDHEALLQFLNRVTPTVCTYLEKNLTSHAFDRYRLLSDIEHSPTSLTHTLMVNALETEFYCSDISWNSIGTALASSYNKHIHKDWCEHDAYVAIWYLNRKDFLPEKPNTLIETDCCITRVAFHPEIPAILAAGKFNGEIIVWNVAKEDDMVLAQSLATVDAHRESITGLYWSKEDKYKLISSSLDGKILIWKYEKKQELQLLEGFIILAEQLSGVMGIKSIRSSAEIGITCMSINSEDPSIFLIGTEGGGVFQCSFNSQSPVPSSGGSGSLIFKFPVTVNFPRLNGHICAVHFSPFVRNIFLCASSDGDLLICSLLQPKPIFKIHLSSFVHRAQWSPIRPLVIATVLENGELQLFDLTVQNSEPVELFPFSNPKTKGTALHFNAQNIQLIGIGSNDGKCHVITLGSQLTSIGSYELEHLKALSKIQEKTSDEA